MALQTDTEIALIKQLVTRTSSLQGCNAEVGVYRGESAKIIHEANPNKTLYLFDSFIGFGELSTQDNPVLRSLFKEPRQFETTQSHFGKDASVVIVMANFPDKIDMIEDMVFSFVHLDLDVYKPTKAGLEIFYPKMVKGGIILLHDATRTDLSVKKALDEFMSNKLEPLIFAGDSMTFGTFGESHRDDTSQVYIIKE